MNFTTPHPPDKQTYGQQQNLTTNIQEQLHKAQILAITKQIKYKSYSSTKYKHPRTNIQNKPKATCDMSAQWLTNHDR